MERLTYIQQLVQEVLEENEKARDDTFVLIGSVIRTLEPRSTALSFNELMQRHEEFNLPSFETITRARRKVVEMRPDLKPSVEVQKILKQREEMFKDYGRNLLQIHCKSEDERKEDFYN